MALQDGPVTVPMWCTEGERYLQYDYPARHTSHASVVSEERPLPAKDRTAAAVQDDHQDARALRVQIPVNK